MSDGKRHCAGIPLSKTLVALRRVRSLRDPSTNSMSKLSAFADNLTWETDSCNALSLRLVNAYQEAGSDNHSFRESNNVYLNGTMEEFGSDPEYSYSWRKSNLKWTSSNKSARLKDMGLGSLRAENIDEVCYPRLRRIGMYVSKSSSDKSLDLEEVDLHSEPTSETARSQRIDSTTLKRKLRCSTGTKSSGVERDVLGSQVDSPYPSLTVSDARVDVSSHSTSVLANEEVDVLDHYHRGCGITCCWSRTPRFRESTLPPDVEHHPLLSAAAGGRETGLSGQERSCTFLKRQFAPYADNPRSFSQKFRPRSFDELVGQHVVARSLLSAISRGRIASFYLFHGPRGTGKTSTSRIFAAALNCLSLEEHKPCGLCRECTLFFSGKSSYVKEVDPASINRTDRLLQQETWATVLNSLEDLPQHVVFVMITADLEKLPRGAISRCQRYHFPKIKDAEVASKLERICVEECLDFDKAALDFIAAKSNGSLRDAEMVLDQLSLLGKRITVSLAYELIGIVSDDELLDLLDLALSSDAPNTVRRARELMKTRVDPMQLISQLANLIMDILAGRCQAEVGRNFFGQHTSEGDFHRLRHALKVLSETEKQLRTSKNQTTWLTVALLQLSSVESSSLDPNDSRPCLRTEQEKEDGFCSTSPTGDMFKHSVSCLCDDNKSHNSEMHEDCKDKLETIWKRAMERCQSDTLRNFLQKEGKLTSLCFNQGVAVAEVEFCHQDHVSRAEKSWKLLASLLCLVLGCNVEIRINLVPGASATTIVKRKKLSFCLLSCSGRMSDESYSTTEDENNHLDHSDFTSDKSTKREKHIESCSSDCGSHFSSTCSHHKATTTTGKKSNGNSLSSRTTTSHKSEHDTEGSQLGVNSSKEEANDWGHQDFSIQEPEDQPSCFSKTVRFHRRLCSSTASQGICLRIHAHNKLELSIPRKASFKTYYCANEPDILCPSSNTCGNSFMADDGQRKESGLGLNVHCWRAPKFPLRRAWLLRQQGQGSHIVSWVLPCTNAK
ncbi:PREDICTED: protein STICHEL-like 2 isoform X2 [Nelumbo nucifera]|uniref:Protein STICHEL-like 2 isoform X2 n=1 Tax=Nelumbo nucifera TaxID=4432 RepID=A0A1U7ZK66_NELNU|nr:PREDICTED: protein STICHEL-like 2 isoform X2 [Nelumbo nucifera]